MKKLTMALSIACGLLGGVLSHYGWTEPVHAQSQVSAPREVRSQSSVLVDDKGEVQGTFSFDESKDDVVHPRRPPIIKLTDGKGREIWEAGGNGYQPLAVR
jgi:hypothetical protein